MSKLFWISTDKSHLVDMDYDIELDFYQNSDGKMVDIVDSTDNHIMLGRYNMKEELDNPYPVTVEVIGLSTVCPLAGGPGIRRIGLVFSGNQR